MLKQNLSYFISLPSICPLMTEDQTLKSVQILDGWACSRLNAGFSDDVSFFKFSTVSFGWRRSLWQHLVVNSELDPLCWRHLTLHIQRSSWRHLLSSSHATFQKTWLNFFFIAINLNHGIKYIFIFQDDMILAV